MKAMRVDLKKKKINGSTKVTGLNFEEGASKKSNACGLGKKNERVK